MMKPKGLLLVCALLALTLTSCGQPESGANTGQSNGSGQFLVDRGGSPAPEGATGSMQGSTVAGIVEKVESNTLRLKDPIVGRTITVQLATNVKILEQAAVQPSEIQQGVHVSVWGKQQGSVYQAEAVQIGAAGALGGGPATIGSHGGEGTATNELTTNSDAPVVPGVLMGIVEQVDGTQLLVKSSDGKTTTVQLLNDVQVGKQKEFGVEALDPGKFAICKGTQTGNTFEATQIELLPPPGAP